MPRKLDSIIERARGLARPERSERGARFQLPDLDPADTGPFKASDKGGAETALEESVAPLS